MQMRSLALLCFASSALTGCASIPPGRSESADYGLLEGTRAWVRGPWDEIRPSANIDDVVDQLCPAVMKQPRATLRDYGQEYCGLLYTLDRKLYYASKPSPLGNLTQAGAMRRKTCYPPRYVLDARGQATPIADFHSHPWAPSGMSEQDRMLRTQLWQIRIQFDTRCTLQKLIPYVGTDRPGEVYERQGMNWKLVGLIEPKNKAMGLITFIGTP
jgi:hypothetical protein